MRFLVKSVILWFFLIINYPNAGPLWCSRGTKNEDAKKEAKANINKVVYFHTLLRRRWWRCAIYFS